MNGNSDVVTIIGAGIAGAACAVALRDAGVAFRLVDRGRAMGGRMASPELHGRRVDIGAGYFTVRDPKFHEVVSRWEAGGFARPWTDTFGVLTPGADAKSTTGPMRWSTPNGLRSLVREMSTGVAVDRSAVDDLPEGDVVLAMPDPQAHRLTDVPEPVDCDPVITVVMGYESLTLPFAHAAFVNDHPVVEFIADDGARRGDGAPVLVAHTTASFARGHLADPKGATQPVVAAVSELIGTPTPKWTHAHRWTFAKPIAQHRHSHGLVQRGGRFVGFAGDQWCPDGSPRVESAWLSGTAVAAAIVDARRG